MVMTVRPDPLVRHDAERMPRPAFDALIAHEATHLAAAVSVLHVAGRAPDYVALRKRMEGVASVEGGRHGREEVVGAAARRLRELASCEELPKVLSLLEWVSERAYGSRTKGTAPCAIQ